MTKEFLGDVDTFLRNSDKKYRAKIAKKTNLSRSRVNFYFLGITNNELITEAIKEDLLRIKNEKEAEVQKTKTDIKFIQKIYEAL